MNSPFLFTYYSHSYSEYIGNRNVNRLKLVKIYISIYTELYTNSDSHNLSYKMRQLN